MKSAAIVVRKFDAGGCGDSDIRVQKAAADTIRLDAAWRTDCCRAQRQRTDTCRNRLFGLCQYHFIGTVDLVGDRKGSAVRSSHCGVFRQPVERAREASRGLDDDESAAWGSDHVLLYLQTGTIKIDGPGEAGFV